MKNFQPAKLHERAHRQDELRNDLAVRMQRERMLQANMESEERVETKRFIRQVQKEEEERHIAQAVFEVNITRFFDS